MSSTPKIQLMLECLIYLFEEVLSHVFVNDMSIRILIRYVELNMLETRCDLHICLE